MKNLVIATLLAAWAAPALAGTDLPALADYPKPSCVKPGPKPVLPQDTPRTVSAGNLSFNTGQKDMRKYNEQVAGYNVALNDYTTCMNAYVANGQADMDFIRDRVNKAVEEGKIP